MDVFFGSKGLGLDLMLVVWLLRVSAFKLGCWRLKVRVCV